jgi:hypothetical protein
MGEIIRGKRRRAACASSVYEKADDDIYIKRQRLNSEGDSNDSSDSDARFVFPSSFRATVCAKQQPAALAVVVKPAERSDVTCADSGKTSPRLRQKIAPSPADAAVPEASVSAVTSGSKERQLHSESATNATEEPAEDNRELNRRSPNGFLLPDPLPRGERLRDTAGQVRECCRPETFVKIWPEVLVFIIFSASLRFFFFKIRLYRGTRKGKNAFLFAVVSSLPHP